VIEKTKSLGLRTQMLSTNVERRLNKERDRSDGVRMVYAFLLKDLVVSHTY